MDMAKQYTEDQDYRNPKSEVKSIRFSESLMKRSKARIKKADEYGSHWQKSLFSVMVRRALEEHLDRLDSEDDLKEKMDAGGI